ncbi:hypothetical protein AQPE_0812 [Aquipluma nitroreducens]|uniref:Uncharacterized protein n=1 Tax=Aquipluma nitroreducens TaxID=2010828 RepID=A0A5K7S577_9BACT|nr:hypothetical protein AQPE_0812 [Aquipluma nitroreducens]
MTNNYVIHFQMNKFPINHLVTAFSEQNSWLVVYLEQQSLK